MMSAERVFQGLLCSGLIAGGWLYGQYWKKSAVAVGINTQSSELAAQNTELTRELDIARDELAQVRSLLSQGSLAIPEDLITFVEKDSGMVFQRAAAAKLGSPALLRDAAERNINLLYGASGPEKEEYMWKALGILSSGEIFRAQQILIETTGTRGLFDLSNGEILLADDFNPMSIPDSGALVHLLARQLQYQNFPPPNRWTSSDEARAWQAVHRGGAASVQSRYIRKRAAAEEIDWGHQKDEREALLLRLSPALQAFANFPYLEGHEFAKRAYITSRKAYLTTFRSPPRSTHAVLYPDEPASTTFLLKDHTGNSIGALGIRALLDPIIGTEFTDRIARGWREDRYQASEASVAWQVVMATPELARDFTQAFQGIEIDGRRINIDGSLVDLTIPSSK